jgi:cell division protein FtsW (lipid II flippase)
MGTGFISDWLKKVGVELPENSGTRPVRLGFDVPLVLISIALVIFGLLMVYSASWDFGYQFQETFIILNARSLVFVASRLWVPAGALSNLICWPCPSCCYLGSLLLVLFIGDERHAQWLFSVLPAFRGSQAGHGDLSFRLAV